MISEDTCWKILGDNFKNKGFVEHQTESFNNFIEHGINKILTEEPAINIVNKNEDNLYNEFSLMFGDVYIPSPTMTEEHRLLRSFTPNEARLRDLTYDSPIYCSITTILKVDGYPDEIEKHLRVVIGRIPIMLRTSKCYLTKMSKNERIKAGECEFDEGGYFIIKGKERVLIPQLRGMYNVPKVFALKKGEKFKLVSEVRSMSDDTGHSALVKCLFSWDDRGMFFKIPYIKDVIPVGVVFKAYGFTSIEEISNLIGIKDTDKIDKYIKYIDRDSYFCNYTGIIPNNIPIVEHDTYVKEKTMENAYSYIGQFSIHTIKDCEKIDYARQVILNELFPHLGVSASNKEKAMYCGLIVNKLLNTVIGKRTVDDRDDYVNKRVEPSGVLCYELVKQLFKKFTQAIVNTIEKKKQIPDALGIISRLPVITNGLKHCFSTGNWGVPKNAYIRTGVSQVLSRLSYGATLSNLRRLTIPVGKESKNTKIRQIHPSQIMYICPSECFEPNIEVLMWDGTIKYGKDIKIGDELIDDRGNAVKVKSVCKGVSNMYEIIPTKSNFPRHKVTDNHILTLKIRNHGAIVVANRTDRVYRFIVTYFDRNINTYRSSHFYTRKEAEKFSESLTQDDTLDITVANYLKLSTYTQEKLVLYKIDGINWTATYNIDPYLLGFWFSRGKGSLIRINKVIDSNIINHLESCDYTIEHSEKNYYRILKNNVNVLSEFLDNYENDTKYINSKYIATAKDFRIKILAGFIDGSGSVRKDNKNEIRINGTNSKLFENIYTIIMSLGFSTNIRSTGEITKELTITGVDTCNIPSVNIHKILKPIGNKLRAKSFLGTRFLVRPSPENDFVGWQLDDDNRGRFLHKSGLVLHNTPEGAPIGIVLNLSLLTKISEKFPTLLLKEILQHSENMEYIDTIDISNQNCKVIINGFIAGVTKNIEEFIKEFKNYRLNSIIPYDVSISYNKLENEIHIFSDEGRLLRPVFTVEGDKLKLKKEDGTDWDNLVNKNIIEYLDNNEIQSKVIAFNQHELKKYKNDYCEIAPAMMLGVMGSIIPWPDHNQCIHKDEPVYMSDGSSKKISDVKVGDEVITFNPKTGQQTMTNVTHTYTNKTDKQLYTITTVNGRKITATYDHRFMTNTGWVRLEHLNINDSLVGISLEQKPFTNKNKDNKIILSIEDFEYNCNYAGIIKHYINTYKVALDNLLPIRVNDWKLVVISRIFGFIASKMSLNIDNTGQCVFHIDFENKSSLELFMEDIRLLEFENKNMVVFEHSIKCTGALGSLLIALGAIYTKNNKEYYKEIPLWISSGSDLIKREFLAGMQGSVGCKIMNFSKKPNLNLGIMVSNTPFSELMFSAEFNIYILSIFKIFDHFNIISHFSGLTNSKIYKNNTILPYYIQNDPDNIINYMDIIGYRYNTEKTIQTGIYTEFLKMSKLENINIEDYETFEKWKCSIDYRSTTLFMPLKSKVECSDNIISDITTFSTNQSFLCGDAFCVHNSPRNCYQAAMGKQAMSMFALTHLIRTDTVSHVLGYPQKPLVTTKAAEMMGFSNMPAGINAIVAIACYTGFNQEDSICLNKNSVERGMFWATTYNTYSEEDKKQGTYMSDKISLPPLDKRRKDLNYSLLDEHGIVRKKIKDKNGNTSVYVQSGDVIIGKCIIHNNKNNEQTIVDNSLSIKKGEEGYIQKVIISTTPNGYKSVKIIIRKVRKPEIGDKFASRSAQKGTTGALIPGEDMPFTSQGITPDIIMNPHALPSRMTINQLMESVLGKSCAIEGTIGDATPFTSSSVNIAEKLCKRLGMNNFNEQGTEMMYSGITGEPIGLVFIGPVYYQRLKHLVIDKMHARAYGPNATLTRQPLEGRSRDGGLRMGEMERDCTIAHGSSVFLKERLGDQSDPYTVTVCDICGNITSRPDECKFCGTDRVTDINLPYVSKLVIQELNSMMIKCKINVEN